MTGPQAEPLNAVTIPQNEDTVKLEICIRSLTFETLNTEPWLARFLRFRTECQKQGAQNFEQTRTTLKKLHKNSTYRLQTLPSIFQDIKAEIHDNKRLRSRRLICETIGITFQGFLYPTLLEPNPSARP
ncbi:glucose-6-phosphate 1-dehydrogenase [Labrenzia sp. EL_208]|nr:glucose-6-phosphate 1-dehydrogenase [Labrenzia sp. EL_132]MBG6230822.1 glucose-6-phosphate 1-dehydrogenase [Labrenzia sp. EL_208]